jgi:hypothetical protein
MSRFFSRMTDKESNLLERADAAIEEARRLLAESRSLGAAGRFVPFSVGTLPIHWFARYVAEAAKDSGA